MLKKGLVVIAVPFVFQLMFIAALWKAQADSGAAQTWAIHTKDVIAQAEAMTRFVSEAQSDVRGLVVTGDRSLSASYEKSARQVPGALGRLRELVDDNEGQRTRVDALGREIKAFMADLAGAHGSAAAGDRGGAEGRLRTLVEKKSAETLRGDVDRFLKEEERLDKVRREALAKSQSRQYAAMVAGTGASVATAVTMMLAFSRGFTRRIAVLADNAMRLAAGEVLASPVGGGDEIARLDGVFHAMAASLAEKDRENEMFIFSVSHDLRSPLVNLQGFSRELALSCDDLREMLERGGVSGETRRRVDALLDRDMATSIKFIQSAVARLSAIIDALLRLSRAGRVEYRGQAVDVAGAVARVSEALKGTTAQRKAEMVVRDLPPAWGDLTAVEQVFANLMGNALNYLDPARPGRVEIGAAEADEVPGPEGEARKRPGGELVTYYVKDNGLGIARAYQSKLFVAFQRLHPEAAPGEGVGLALVRRVVERLGGRIWCDSEEGRGSTFYFTLPAAQGSGSGSATNSRAPAGRVPAGAAAVNGEGGGAKIWPQTR